MHRPGIIPRLWEFARHYLVALILIAIFMWTAVEVYVLGVGPTPQQPPPGFVEERLEARVQWHKGNILKPIKLEVSLDDPEFHKPFVDKNVSGNTELLNNLVPGHTYYWRLKQAEKPSATYHFKTATYAIAF